MEKHRSGAWRWCLRAGLAAGLAWGLTACSSGGSPSGDNDAGATGDASATGDGAVPRVINWEQTADLLMLADDGVYTFQCTAMGRPNLCWGTDRYSSDTSICTAAVHAQIISLSRGGTFTLQMRPGLSMYVGTNRGGIYSGDRTSTARSFVFLTTPGS